MFLTRRRRLACMSGASLVSPASISGLTAWYKADGTLWQDSARTTPAVLDADPVGAWDDASGNGNHLTQATTTKRGTLKLNIKSGKPIIRFDGVDDNLRSAAFGAALSQPYTTLAVYTMRAYNAADSKVIYTGLADSPQWADITAFWRMFAGTAVNTVLVPDANWHVNSAEWNGASSKYRLDGGTETTISSTVGAGTMTGAILATTSTGTTPGDLDFAEFLVYSGALTTKNKTDLFTYLNSRWGVY